MASIQQRPGGRWRARYRDSGGREHARHFASKGDARIWLDQVATSMVTGQYVEPKAGKITFREYAELWRMSRVHRASSEVHVESMLRRHVYPTIGGSPIGLIIHSDIQRWVRTLCIGSELAPSTVRVIHGIVSSIFRSAVRDRRIVANPCEGTRLPRPERRLVLPMTTAQVLRLRDEMPTGLRALVTVAAGTGMRQGEVFGLTRDRLRLDGDDPIVIVDRQLRTLPGPSTAFGPVKTSASRRALPLPKAVVSALAIHFDAFDVADDGLVFRHQGAPLTRSAFGHVWRPAAKKVGLTTWTGTGMHALRHYYASLLIRYGESVVTVQARLGHASPTETLGTYAHLWHDSNDRTRSAVDAELLG